MQGCLYSPDNRLRGLTGGGGARKGGEGFKEAVVHLQVSPSGLIGCERLREAG